MKRLSRQEIENLLNAAIATTDTQQRKRIRERLCAAVSEKRKGAIGWLWNVWRQYGSPLDIPEIAWLFAAVIAGEPEEEE